MASLILRGQDMSTIEEKIRKVYVRPIMKPETWNNKVIGIYSRRFFISR